MRRDAAARQHFSRIRLMVGRPAGSCRSVSASPTPRCLGPSLPRGLAVRPELPRRKGAGTVMVESAVAPPTRRHTRRSPRSGSRSRSSRTDLAQRWRVPRIGQLRGSDSLSGAGGQGGVPPQEAAVRHLSPLVMSLAMSIAVPGDRAIATPQPATTVSSVAPSLAVDTTWLPGPGVPGPGAASPTSIAPGTPRPSGWPCVHGTPAACGSVSSRRSARATPSW